MPAFCRRHALSPASKYGDDRAARGPPPGWRVPRPHVEQGSGRRQRRRPDPRRLADGCDRRREFGPEAQQAGDQATDFGAAGSERTRAHTKRNTQRGEKPDILIQPTSATAIPAVLITVTRPASAVPVSCSVPPPVLMKTAKAVAMRPGYASAQRIGSPR